MNNVWFCEKCGRNVKTVTRNETVQFPINGEMQDIAFPASYCPFCGTVLCEQGFDQAFAKLIENAEKTANKGVKEVNK